MIHALVLSIAIASTGAARWMSVARPLWEQQLKNVDGRAVESNLYPTEPALVHLTAYDLTRDRHYADQAARQLEYAHDRMVDGLMLPKDGFTTRDYQARQIYNFYVAYRILGDGRYLAWADEAAHAMLRRFPRSAYTCRGETHELLSADFVDRAGMTRPAASRIDVNQNSEVALAFSLLYHDPASTLFQSQAAKSVAHEELLAAMSLQNMTSGEIPLTENIPGADTAYGSYAAFCWTWCQLLWKEPRFEPHVRAAGRWLATKRDLAHDCYRVYPKEQKTWVPSWQANYCLAVYWYCGVDAKAFIESLCVRSAQPEQTPGDSPAPLYWAYFDVMGMPRAFYLEGASVPSPTYSGERDRVRGGP